MEGIEQTSNLKSSKKYYGKNFQMISELKKELSMANKFIEYFAIIGLDPKIAIENFLFNSTLEELQKCYTKELKPGIISKFPPINKSYINIDDSLISLCFPDGFKLEKYEKPPEYEIINFLLGNYFYSIEYPLKYVTCLKIYESLDNYYSLHLKLKENMGINNFEIRKTSKNIFNSELFLESENVSRNSVCPNKVIDYLINDSNKIKENDFKKYYFPKIICFISLKPFYNYQKEILLQIYDYYKNQDNITKPLEKIVLNILCNIPMPPKGLNVYHYNLEEKYKKVDIKEVRMNKLKNIDEEVFVMFKYFNTNNLIEIFKYVLFETKTIVFGTKINDLCSFIYSIISILYPFTYPFQVSSCIHKNAFEVLESISPYIIGINKKYYDSFFAENNIEIKGTSFITVDLDNKEYIINVIDELPNIPKNLVKRLKTRLENNIKKYEKNKNEENEENWICYSFFEFYLNIMHNYGDYLNNENLKKNYKISSLKVMFKIKEFVESHSNNERDFYKKFVETQMFNDFIFKKMIPKDINDKLEVLFFDEYINKKNNKKLFSKNKPIIFLNSKEYEYKDNITIPRVRELNKKEKKRYNDTNYILKNLLLAQEVRIENKNEIIDLYEDKDIFNDENKSENLESKNYYFHYLLFPKFNKDFFNFPSYEYYSYTNSMAKDINRINTDLLAISHNNGETVYDEGTLDYIYLTYLEAWGYCYYYQENIERYYRFEQMLDVLNKIKHHEIEIINILFEALNKFQEKDKIIKLYDKILTYKITPNSFIYSIIGKLSKIQDEEYEILIEKSNFLRRTFRSENEKYILGDNISFNYIQECPDCNKLINLEKISKDNKNSRKDVLWAKCPLCENFILPKMSVNLGSFISNIPCFKKVDFTLNSPYNLKNALKDIIDKQKLLNVDTFKSNFPNEFWSCIWYFSLYNLDYDIILPYEINIFKSKRKFSLGTNLNYINSTISQNIKNNTDENKENIDINKINNIKYKNKYVIQKNYSLFYMKNICFTYYGVISKSSKIDNSFSFGASRKKTFYKNNKRSISTFFNEPLTQNIDEIKEKNNQNSIDKNENIDFFAYKKNSVDTINVDIINMNTIKKVKFNCNSINENENKNSKKNNSLFFTGNDC